MWARIHKLDRVRPLASGGAIVLLEDDRTGTQMQRNPPLSTLFAIARVLGARRALEVKFDGKGEVRYVSSATMPSYLSEAITRAGASIADQHGDRVVVPASASGVAALIDVAFSELAHHVRGALGAADINAALTKLEERRSSNPLDRDKQPEQYWTAVFELAALAGEQSRKRGGRWVDTRDLPVPFALKFADGKIAHPTNVAQKLVEGGAADDMLSTDKSGPVVKPEPDPSASE